MIELTKTLKWSVQPLQPSSTCLHTALPEIPYIHSMDIYKLGLQK